MSVLEKLTPIPEPSTDYESKSLGTWSSAADVDIFFNSHNEYNGFKDIKIGNYVTIRDGTYNKIWVVAGFNLEHNITASDGTVYDNGYGILMIPETYLINAVKWNNIDTNYCSYIQSTMHTSTLVTAANNLKNILGDHLIERNVLLGSEQNGTSPRQWTTSAYQWTTSYLTLPSVWQIKFASGVTSSAKHNNKYDDGEASYQLPLFNHIQATTNNTMFWFRNVYGCINQYSSNNFYAYKTLTNGAATQESVSASQTARPLMLLR